MHRMDEALTESTPSDRFRGPKGKMSSVGARFQEAIGHQAVPAAGKCAHHGICFGEYDHERLVFCIEV